MIVIIPDNVKAFLNSLDSIPKSKVRRGLDKLSIYTYLLGMPLSKKVGKNLYELRVLGTVNVRIFYTFYQENILLLHGFIKKSNKTPKRDLRIASQRLKLLT